MYMKSQELARNKYFENVLGGEFYLPGDPEKSYLTLGWLATTTKEEGNVIIPESCDGQPSTVQTYSYRPSWAENVDTRVAVVQVNGSKGLIRGIGLYNPENDDKRDGRLRFSYEEQEDDGLTFLHSPVLEAAMPLRPGKELEEAREFVTAQAQKFFENNS